VISQIRDGASKRSRDEQDPYAVLSCRADARRIGIERLRGHGVVRIRGPAGLPAPVLERLYGEMAKIMKDPTVREKLSNLDSS